VQLIYTTAVPSHQPKISQKKSFVDWTNCRTLK
jgi:hypothetical protein